ncbi:uncharacterized protein BCR38DRAFT_460817 [Pseudomassariella vexata]|uniref:Aminoglycoside phosphotransferase domain-containing protein n=1 Tax=Pseudomassariella vexata TaxID=1141098 RepID=A0A1Y2DGT9_9PEZI|nr:uncharacterized protein BCR38DRAFT_460817 [Pseudomassariella vexata]ORY58472.1 hypothetical protein BCR38DRAFT_460817 [Pseudomassariella vexata]
MSLDNITPNGLTTIDRSDELWEEAMEQVRLLSTCCKVESLAESLFGKPVNSIDPLIIGGFNVLYPIQIKDSSPHVLVRLPCPNQAVFPEEKTLAEAATAAYIRQHTQPPVSEVFYHGIDPDIGPFMIIQDLGSCRVMGQALEAPAKTPTNVKMARCVLQLPQLSFPRIGALIGTGTGSYGVVGRPITLNMSNMVQLSNILKSIFPPEDITYETADERYVVLAEMQIGTLLFQHNDIVSSEDDCRTNSRSPTVSQIGYTRPTVKLWYGPHATLPAPDGSASFRLWSDNFRPVGVVLDENNNEVLGAIDWEFAYVCPTQFVLDCPWWLLLDVSVRDHLRKTADDVAFGYGRGRTRHDSRRFPSLGVLRESWGTGRFWLNYAARRSWAFDTIYWKYLDQRFFDLWKTRVHLLRKERAAMESLVQIKMEESKDRVLIKWDADMARQRLSSSLLD